MSSLFDYCMLLLALILDFITVWTGCLILLLIKGSSKWMFFNLSILLSLGTFFESLKCPLKPLLLGASFNMGSTLIWMDDLWFPFSLNLETSNFFLMFCSHKSLELFNWMSFYDYLIYFKILKDARLLLVFFL